MNELRNEWKFVWFVCCHSPKRFFDPLLCLEFVMVCKMDNSHKHKGIPQKSLMSILMSENAESALNFTSVIHQPFKLTDATRKMAHWWRCWLPPVNKFYICKSQVLSWLSLWVNTFIPNKRTCPQHDHHINEVLHLQWELVCRWLWPHRTWPHLCYLTTTR